MRPAPKSTLKKSVDALGDWRALRGPARGASSPGKSRRTELTSLENQRVFGENGAKASEATPTNHRTREKRQLDQEKEQAARDGVSWQTVGALAKGNSGLGARPMGGFEKFARGAAKWTKVGLATALLVGGVGALALDINMAQSRDGALDLSPEGFAARLVNDSAMRPMTAATFHRYIEASALADLSYKGDLAHPEEGGWLNELAQYDRQGRVGRLPNSIVTPVAFHPERLGVYESGVSAMRMFEVDLAGQRVLVVSFSGSDDLLDFVRDSNGLGALDHYISPRTSEKELRPGMDEALALIKKTAGDYNRVVIAGHSLGGYLANQFANQLADSEQRKASSPILSKTQLLTVNTLYLQQEEPPALASIEHFREPGELTDLVGNIGLLRPPAPEKVIYVGGAAVADKALKKELELMKGDASWTDKAGGTARNAYALILERAELVISRHLNANAARRIENFRMTEGLSAAISPEMDITARACAEPLSAAQQEANSIAALSRAPEGGLPYNAQASLPGAPMEASPTLSAPNVAADGRRSVQTGTGRDETAVERQERKYAPTGVLNTLLTQAGHVIGTPLGVVGEALEKGSLKVTEHLADVDPELIATGMNLSAWRAKRSPESVKVAAGVVAKESAALRPKL